MQHAVRVLATSAALMLLGCGLWANVSNAPFPEMRGLWVTQAMRGGVY